MAGVNVPPPPRGGVVLNPTGQFVQPWSGWFRKIYELLNYHSTAAAQTATNTTDIQTIQQSLTAGFNGTITLAALTQGGTQGHIVTHNGIITGYTAPT